MSKVRWEEMFLDEMQAAVAARPVCYLAYGLAEPHGVQNALGLDGLKAQALVERAARAHGGVVAPMTWWHVHETPRGLQWLRLQHAPVTYLTDVPAEVFLHQLVYQLRAVESAGFRAAVMVTGHYGGIEVDMKMVAAAYAGRRPLRVAAVSDGELIRYRDYRGDHAGPCETSQLWALRPELVDLSRMPEAAIEGTVFASGEAARRSSRREGERIVASQVGTLKRLADGLLDEGASLAFTGGFPMGEAEAVWHDVLAQREQWVSSHPAEGDGQAFREHVRKRAALFPIPVRDWKG